jgi:transcriptional regulator with XRE-family HTH domain
LKERLQMALEQSPLNQSGLARAVNVTPAYISALVKGKRDNVSDEKLSAIARALSVSLNWLKTGEGDMKAVYEERTEKTVTFVQEKPTTPPPDESLIREFVAAMSERDLRQMVKNLTDRIATGDVEAATNAGPLIQVIKKMRPEIFDRTIY